MSTHQDSRDFIRRLSGMEPAEVLEQHHDEVDAAQALERQQQEATRTQRLDFIRRLTGTSTTTEKESTHR